jgi:hypothetical protein
MPKNITDKEKEKWTQEQLDKAQAPIMKAFSEAIRGAYTKPEVIIEALSKNKEEFAGELRRIIASIVLLDRPGEFNMSLSSDYMTVTDDINFRGKIEMSRLELISVLEAGEEKTSGDALLEKARRLRLTSFGRHHGQFFVDNWFEEIKDIRIALPGTIYQRKGDGTKKGDGYLFMSSFYRSGNAIISDSEYLGREFDSKWFFLRMKKR